MSNRSPNRPFAFGHLRVGTIFGLVAATLTVGAALQNGAWGQESEAELKRFILIGLCEPADDSPETLAGFNEWFVNQHVEDVAHGPNFVRGRVYALRGQHLSAPTYTDYISVYEVDAPSWEEAERALNEWQRNPNAWEGRAHHTETGKRVGNVLSCPGSGWYELLGSWDGPAKATTAWE